MRTVGAAVGAPLGGFGADKAGRKVVICASDGLFILGSLVMGAATNVWWLIVGRFIVGLGIGFASNTVPIYLSELAPRASRGTLVTINIVFICTGQFASYLVAALFAHVEGGWRWMLGLGVVPATIQLVGMLLAAPERYKGINELQDLDLELRCHMSKERNPDIHLLLCLA
jgi:SP family myo-inositol transporter-like MFS transporter 13